jgi:hypothetical protein
MAFRYYAQIPVNYSSDGAQTDYQMKLTIVKGTGSNTAGTIYLNNHSSNWPYDIQFKNASGTVLDYWREEYDATDMTVWVKCDSIAASGETDFYLYYGDSGASDASDGESAFIFYDPCNNMNKWTTWTQGNGSWTIDNGRFKFSGPSGNSNQEHGYSNDTVCGAQGGVAVHAKINNTDVSNYSLHFGLSTVYPNDGNFHSVADLSNFPNYSPIHTLSDGGSSKFSVERATGMPTGVINFELRSKSGNQSYLFDNVSQNAQTQAYDMGSSMRLYFYGVSAWSDSHLYYVDDIFVRKWTYNEPTWGIPGSEQEGPSIMNSQLIFPRRYRSDDDLSFLPSA